jgi:hypothetical protein
MHSFAQKSKAAQQTTSARSTISGRGHRGQSPGVSLVRPLQRTIENQAVQRILRTDAEEPEADPTRPASLRFEHDFSRIAIHPPAAGAIQTKLSINEQGDSYEPGREHESLRTKRVQASGTGQIAAPPIVHETLRSPGQPLDPATRAFMESRFGYDFSRVRVHVGGAAEKSARDVNAHAYTVGHDIVFGAGRFAPEAHEGRRLIAHELAHVVQAGSTTSNSTLRPSSVETLEREARRVAEAVGSADTIPPIRGSARGLMVPLRQGPDEPGKATFSNLPRDMPDKYVPLGRVVLSEEGGVWYEERLGGKKFRAEGAYDFVVQNGKIWAVTVTRSVRIGGPNRGHTEAAAGGPVEYAGRVSFGKEKATRGVLLEWSNASGHYAPVSHKKFAKAAGLPTDDTRFKPVTEGFPEKGPQVPVYQPQTRSRDGGPPKVPPGPPRLGELEAHLRASRLGTKSQLPSANPSPVTTGVKAKTRAPLTPVDEATPGFKPGAGARLGSAAQALQGRMFGNLQQAEIARYEKRSAELQPKIDAYLRSGYSVEVILIVEKPNRPDVLCGVFCDQGQFIYFHDLYINYVESVQAVTSTSRRAAASQTSMSPRGGRDNWTPLRHQGGRDIDETQIRHLPARHPDHHCEYAKHTLYPQASIPPVQASPPPAQPVKARPPLDPATRKALAYAPSRVYILSENINQNRTVYEIQKKLTGNASFVVVKDEMAGGLNRGRTVVSYFSDLDKPRAEALAAIVRSEGVSSANAELDGDGDDAPGVLQIFFGRDAEK